MERGLDCRMIVPHVSYGLWRPDRIFILEIEIRILKTLTQGYIKYEVNKRLLVLLKF